MLSTYDPGKNLGNVNIDLGMVKSIVHKFCNQVQAKRRNSQSIKLILWIFSS